MVTVARAVRTKVVVAAVAVVVAAAVVVVVAVVAAAAAAAAVAQQRTLPPVVTGARYSSRPSPTAKPRRICLVWSLPIARESGRVTFHRWDTHRDAST